MKKTLSLVLILALLFCAGAFAKGTYLGTMTVVNCDSWVTLRSKPSTSASSVSRVPKGAQVEAYSYNSQFMECYYLGQHGYILSSYLSGGDDGDYLGSLRVVNCDSWVTLRAKPSTSAATVARVPKGQYVDAYYYNDKFCYCEYKGMGGYILSKYLGGGSSSKSKDYMGEMTVVNCDSWVTLRAKPSTSASSVSRVPLGATVEAYYYNSQFAECYYLGQHGYILMSYLD